MQRGSRISVGGDSRGLTLRTHAVRKGGARARLRFGAKAARVTSGFDLISFQSNTNMYYIPRVYTVIAFMFATKVPMRLSDIQDACDS